MVDQTFNFYYQQYRFLMRAIITAIDALDNQQPEQARTTLSSAWDASVQTSYQAFVLETGR